MEFKDEVLYARARLNLTQKEFGQLLHVSLATINRWETGKVLPTKKDLTRFKQLCNDNKIGIIEVKDD